MQCLIVFFFLFKFYYLYLLFLFLFLQCKYINFIWICQIKFVLCSLAFLCDLLDLFAEILIFGFRFRNFWTPHLFPTLSKNLDRDFSLSLANCALRELWFSLFLSSSLYYKYIQKSKSNTLLSLCSLFRSRTLQIYIFLFFSPKITSLARSLKKKINKMRGVLIH